MLPPDDLMEFDRLESNVLLTILYMLAVPVLGLMALAAGAAARRDRMGQIGFALGAAAAVAYALALRAAHTI